MVREVIRQMGFCEISALSNPLKIQDKDRDISLL